MRNFAHDMTKTISKTVVAAALMLTTTIGATAQSDTAKTTNNALYYRLFVPTTFYHEAAHKSLAISDDDDPVQQEIDQALMHIYLQRPDLVRQTETQLRQAGTIREELEQTVKPKAELAEKAPTALAQPEEEIPVQVIVKKPNFWKFSGDYYFQFLQNFYTDNWYKGGESNYSALASATLQANYDNKSKFKWENKLELKLGLQTLRDDTLRSVRTNNDLIRYTGKVGIQAAKNWYYTLQTIATTQFSRSYKTNDQKVYSDFLSPFTLNIGVGLDYKANWMKGKITGTINFSLLAYNLRYVDRPNLNTANGIDADHRSKNDFGSGFTADLKWKITDILAWKTRLYYYTSYERALLEWENTISLQVSKIIAANLFFYPRFDDSRDRDDKYQYWQFKEYSSIGFTFSF